MYPPPHTYRLSPLLTKVSTDSSSYDTCMYPPPHTYRLSPLLTKVSTDAEADQFSKLHAVSTLVVLKR
jgi:hypothetical protein